MLNHLLNQVNSSRSFSRLNVSVDTIYDWIITNVHTRTHRQIGLKLLSRLMGMSNRCKSIFIRQDTLARKLGCCREIINKWIKKFDEWGILNKVYRHMTSCLYIINPIFYNKSIREELRLLIKPFFFLSVALLSSLGLSTSQIEKDSYIFRNKDIQAETSHNELLRSNISTTYLSTSLPKLRNIKGDTSPNNTSGRGRIDKDTSLRRETVLEGMKPVKRLKLTRAGEIKLAMYPPEAIEYANKEYFSYKGKVGDHFKFYSTLCRKWCDENDKKRMDPL